MPMGTIPFVLGNAVHPKKGVGRDGIQRTLEDLGKEKRRVANFTGGFAAIFFEARAAVVPCHGGVGCGVVGRGVVGHGGDGRGDATGQGNGSEERNERFVEQHCKDWMRTNVVFSGIVRTLGVRATFL